MDFDLRGWPPQSQIFSSSSTKITTKRTILNFSFDMFEAVQAMYISSKLKIHSKGKKECPFLNNMYISLF